jgi:hypothetical protein
MFSSRREGGFKESDGRKYNMDKFSSVGKTKKKLFGFKREKRILYLQNQQET